MSFIGNKCITKKRRERKKKTSWNKNKKAIRNQTKNYAVL